MNLIILRSSLKVISWGCWWKSKTPSLPIWWSPYSSLIIHRIWNPECLYLSLITYNFYTFLQICIFFFSNVQNTSALSNSGWDSTDNPDNSNSNQYRPLLLGGGRNMARDLLVYASQAYTESLEIVKVREERVKAQRSSIYLSLIFYTIDFVWKFILNYVFQAY